MAFPTGETAALITSLLWALSSTLFAVGTRRYSPQAVNRLRLLGAFLLLSLTYTITQGGWFPRGVVGCGFILASQVSLALQ